MIDEEGKGFGVSHQPLGVGADGLVVRIGNYALHLSRLFDDGILQGVAPELIGGRSVIGLLGDPRARDLVRRRIAQLVADDSVDPEPFVTPVAECSLDLPFDVGDYVDFYSCRNHAQNLGKILRPGTPPLAANWEVIPIGYHGRSGTVVISGTPVVRPSGVVVHEGVPQYAPTGKLDIEAELGYVVVRSSERGRPVAAQEFKSYVGGVVLLNDWSARDLQAFEYVPLGPFLGKSFATSISAWVTPLEALEPYRLPGWSGPRRDLAYLQDERPFLPDLEIEIELNGEVVSRSGTRFVDWSPGQQLSHMTANGATVAAGDLFATGTLSGPLLDQVGSLIERTWNGAEPLILANGEARTFLEDGDTVTLRAKSEDGCLSLGEVRGTVVKGHEPPRGGPEGADD